jgi:CysZ protein
MIEAARLALKQLFSPAFRGVFFKSLGLTIATLIAAWIGLTALFDTQVEFSNPWLDTISSILAGFGFFIGAIFLIVPVTTLVAGIFLDDIAEVVEARWYPHEPVGKALPLGEALWTALLFTLVVIAVNLVALILLLLPGINIIIFLVANGYLLGREYFELAARRYKSADEAKAMRKQNRGTIFISGLMIAGVLAIPIVNLLTPLFATAVMVHVHKRLSGSKPVKENEIILPS